MAAPKTKQLSVAELKAKWANRHRDPKLHAKWVAEIRVTPADSEKGKPHGIRHYPDGSNEPFTVERR